MQLRKVSRSVGFTLNESATKFEVHLNAVDEEEYDNDEHEKCIDTVEYAEEERLCKERQRERERK